MAVETSLCQYFTSAFLKQYSLKDNDFRYIKDIVNTKISMFTYEGLPDDITSQILETGIMFRNHLCIKYVKGIKKYMYGYYVPMGTFDDYLKPLTCNFMSFKGNLLEENVDFKDLILIRDNIMDIVPIIYCSNYIERVKKIENTLTQQLNIISLPLVLVCNEKTKTQMKNIAAKADINEPFVLGDKTIIDNAKAFPISVPISPLDIYELKQKYKNECLQSLGIYTIQEKQERLITQEISTQNDYTDFIYQAAKLERQRFVDELNKSSEGKLHVKLIELYMLNVMDTSLEDREKAKAEAQGQAEGIKAVDPNANVGKGGIGNGN